MCGLFGFSTYGTSPIRDVAKLVNALAQESAVRGIDATGIAYCRDGRIQVQKEAVSAYKLNFKPPQTVRALIGHTRHSTQGSEKKNYNNHPFTGKAGGTRFALAHNGVLTNDETLKVQYHLPQSKIETDSYVAVQLITNQQVLNFHALRHMAETVRGSFSFSMLDDRDNLYLVKGDSPLSVLHFPKEKLYVYASTDEILYRALIETPLFEAIKDKAYEVIGLDAGTILKIKPDGNLEQDEFAYQLYTGKSWYNYGWSTVSTARNDCEDEYIEELRRFACYAGFDPEIVDELIGEGFSPFEVEEYIYAG